MAAQMDIIWATCTVFISMLLAGETNKQLLPVIIKTSPLKTMLDFNQ
jgi:hypothetical protein